MGVGAVSKILLYLANLLWKKEEPELLSLSFTIGGKVIPAAVLKPLADKVPDIFKDIAAGKDAREIAASLEPEILQVVETVANAFFPGAGTAIEIFAAIIERSHPMSPEEEATWFRNAQGDIGAI